CPLPPPSMPLPITSPPEICTLSLHDALPIFVGRWIPGCLALVARLARRPLRALAGLARRVVHHLTARPFLGQLVRFLALRHLTRSEEHTSELQSPYDLVCRLLLEKKN